MDYSISLLPVIVDVESKTVLKKVANAHRSLAELKGATNVIPNQSILINTLSLQEAKDSSAIENIITTHDELFKTDILKNHLITIAAKEVNNYAKALRSGFESVRETGLLTNNFILKIQREIEENNAGYRKLPGTSLKNDLTGEIIYTPPQHPNDIIKLMDNLEAFINDDKLSDLDPLVKMAVIHHQFESIHPFYDGNGRTGRIINILYLVKENLLNIPVLYLSRYININKSTYYSLLQHVRDTGVWEEWIIFLLEGVIQTSHQAISLIYKIKSQMQSFKNEMREKLPKIYSQDLLNNLFYHPYTKIDFIVKDLGISRVTATRYLEELVKVNLLNKQKIGRENYYVNQALYDLLSNAGNKHI